MGGRIQASKQKPAAEHQGQGCRRATEDRYAELNESPGESLRCSHHALRNRSRHNGDCSQVRKVLEKCQIVKQIRKEKFITSLIE